MDTLKEDGIVYVEVIRPVSCFQELFPVGSVHKAKPQGDGYMLEDPATGKCDCYALKSEVQQVTTPTELSTADQELMGIDAILEERGNRYGSFEGHAEITQALKKIMADAPQWDTLTDSMKEALEMVAHKVGRILNGDPFYADSWVDIVGYTQLIVDGDHLRDK